MKKDKRIMIIAGEASGDMHGAKLTRSLKKQIPNLKIFGIGGKAMGSEGVDILVDAEQLSVVGITEVLSKLPVIRMAIKAARLGLKRLKPDLLILIDFPDFNLHMASIAKKLGIRVLYYISPQIWAWRQGRVHKIRRIIDHMAVILPFEEKFYQDHNVPATFVGHPLLDDPNLKLTEKNQPIQSTTPLVGLLPGSRDKEVSSLLPMMLGAAKQMMSQNRNIKFIVSRAHSIEDGLIEAIVQQHGQGLDLEIDASQIEKGLFQNVQLVIAASGTVTLQAAIYGVPMLIVYKVSPLSFRLGKLLIKVNYIGLVNLIYGRRIVPELIQEAASPESVSKLALEMLSDPDLLKNIKTDLLKVRAMLGNSGASERVARIARDLINT